MKNPTLNAFCVGLVVGGAIVAKLAVDNNKKFIDFDAKKNVIMEDMFAELQKHAPEDVVERIKTDAVFFNIAVREG